MTRGKIAIIVDLNKIISSIEFNGDMYPEECGHGLDVIKALKKVKTKEAFYKMVNDFNDENFQYEEEQLTYEPDDSYFDMSTDYFDKRFSDYVYVKNLTDHDINFKLSYGKSIDVKPKEVMVFNFGSLWLDDTQQQERLELIGDLQTIKENLSCLNKSKQYSDIYNKCVDYDNTYNDLNLTDYICEENFMDDYDVEEYVKNNADDVNRLRYFLGDTYDDEIYKLDGYGNLQNVDDTDFECLIDELTSTIHNAIVDDLNIERKKQNEM